MSTSYYAQLILGGVVEPGEVYAEQPTVVTKCQTCIHALAMNHKFCHDCGNPFVRESRRVWKEPVLQALQKKNPQWKAEWSGPEMFEAPFFDVADRIVVGQQLAHVAHYSRGLTSISASQLDDARERVQALFQEMQLPNREICLFPYVFCC